MVEAQSNCPNFFVVGCVKGGTTSLHQYLAQHPDIYLTPIKETNFLSRKDMSPSMFGKDYALDIRIDLEKYFKRRPLKPVHIAHIYEYEDYLNLFSEVTNERILGEVCNSYLICPSAAGEIKSRFPNAKIAMIIRNPINRAFSHYLMNVKEGKCINTPFLEEIESDYAEPKKGWGITHQYLELGLYASQIKNFYHHFPKDQIKIILYDDYKKSPKNTLMELCQFLGINHTFKFDTSLNFNVKGTPRFKYLNYYMTSLGVIKLVKPLLSKDVKRKILATFFSNKNVPVVSKQEKQYLLDFYSEDIKSLSKLINRDLSDWLRIS